MSGVGFGARVRVVGVALNNSSAFHSSSVLGSTPNPPVAVLLYINNPSCRLEGVETDVSFVRSWYGSK